MALEKAGLQLILEGGQKFTAGLAEAGKATKGLVGHLADAGKAVAGAGLAAGAAGALALGGGIAVAAKAGLGFNNAMEQTTAKLNAFTKDGKKSAAILEDIKKEASLTPFAFEEMATATASLLPVAKASGKELMDLVKTAEVLAASNPAEGLEGAAFALKEAASGDLTSIIERFNLPRQRLKELKDEGVPAIEAVGIAMKELGLDADLVSNMANTASGRWSTFQDTLTNLAAIATKPIFDAFSEGLGNVNGLLDENAPKLEEVATLVGEKIGGAIAGIIQGVKTFGESWKAASEFTSSFLEQLGGTIDLMIGSEGTFQTLGDTINTVFTTIGPMVSDAITRVQEFIGENGIGGVSPVLGALLTVAQTIFPALQQLVMTVFGGIVAFFQENGQSMLGDVISVWGQIQVTISQVATAIGAVINAVFGQIQIFLAAHGTEIAAFFKTAWGLIVQIIQGALAIINATVVPILQGIAAFINEHSVEIQAIMSLAWTAISTIITTALGVIQGIITAVLALIRGDWEGFGTALMGIVNTLMSGLKTIIQSELAIIEIIWLTLWNGLKTKFQAILDSIVGWVKQTFEAVKNAITSVADGIGSAAASVGSAIVSGIVGAIKSGVGAIASAARSAAEAALSAAKSFLGIGSPSKVAAAEVGKPYTQGVALGIKNNADLIAKAASGVSAGMIAPLARGGTMGGGSQTTYSSQTTYNLGVTTNQSPAVVTQSYQLMQAMAL